MTFDKRGRDKISSRDYAYARELLSTIPISEETRKKLSASIKIALKKPEVKKHMSTARSGKNNPMYNMGYKISGEKNGKFGMIVSDISRKKMRKPKSEKGRENIAAAQRERRKKEKELCSEKIINL